MTASNAQAWNMKHILLNNLGSKCSLEWNLASLCNIKKWFFLLKNSTKNVAWKLVQALFNFQRILCKKDSAEVSMLIWLNFYRFAIAYLSSLFQKFHLPIEVMLHSLQTQKGLELVFRWQFLWTFSMKFFFCNMT